MVADRSQNSFFQRVAFWQPSNVKWSPFKNFWLPLFSFFCFFICLSPIGDFCQHSSSQILIFTCHGDQNGCSFSPLAAPHFLINFLRESDTKSR